MGASMSHNRIGLHCLLQGQLNFFYFYLLSSGNSDRSLPIFQRNILSPLSKPKTKPNRLANKQNPTVGPEDESSGFLLKFNTPLPGYTASHPRI
jgi:hypothetical protein